MKRSILAIAAILASCAGATPMQATDEPSEAVEPGPERFGEPSGSVEPALEERFAAFMREPILLARPMPADGMRIVLARQLKLYQDLGGEYGKVVKATENPEKRALPIFRRAQLFVRLGCSIVQSPPPNRLAEDQIEVYRGILRDQAIAPIEQAANELEMIPAEHPLAEHASRLAELPEGTAVEDLDLYCANRSDYWQHSKSVSVDATESERCEDGDAVACYVWAELGSGGTDAMARACELGVQIACPGGTNTDDSNPTPGTGVYGPGGMRGE